MRQLVSTCLVISFGFVSACVVGAQDPGPGDDDGVGTSPDAGDDPTPGPDAEPVECIPAAPTLPNGNHNAGLACLSCHNGVSVGAPQWTLAGTLYNDRNGTAALSGATILVTDNNGVQHELVTAANGNFYTGAALAFPVTVSASKCPDTKAMTGKPQSGDCNSCHTANASQGRIHLP